MAIKVVIGSKENPVRFSYANVWEAKSINGSDPKFSVSIIIPKSDKKTIEKIKKAIEEAKQEGVTKLGGKIPSNLKTPLRDGDMEKEDDEAYADSYFINANSNTKPGIVDGNVEPILDQTELYSGCYGKVSVNFYAYNASGTKGIAAWLNHLQKLKDGEPLSGSSKPEDDFEVEEDDFLD